MQFTFSFSFYPLSPLSCQAVSNSGGCSDPSDLDLNLRAELDSPASSCEFPCNCIASGNQIGHKLNVNTPEACGEWSACSIVLHFELFFR